MTSTREQRRGPWARGEGALAPVLACALVLAFPGESGAQRAGGDPPVAVQAQANASHVRVGDVFQLDVTVTLSGASGEPEELVLPDLSDFEVVRQERGPTSQRRVSINGRVSASRTFGFVFHLRATTPGEKTIGASRVRMAGHVARSEPIVVQVAAREPAGQGGLSSALDPAARFAGKEVPPVFLDARFDRDEAWIGQQVLFTVDVYTTEYVDLDLRGLAPPKPPGFFTEVLDAPTRIRPTQRTLNGKSYLVYQVMRVAMFPLEPGEHVLEPLGVTVLATRGGWRRRSETRLLSDPVALVVKPLPDAQRPPGFSTGNVGHWQLRATVSEPEVPLGQPFTLEVTAGGEGNLQALSLPKVEQQITGARVFPPTTNEVKGVQQGRLHGEKSVELLVQPTRAGVFTVPSFTLPYFDPVDGKYKEARSQPVSVRVKPSAVDDGARGEGSGRIRRNARPVMRQLAVPDRSGPLYESPAYLGVLAGGSLLGLVGFFAGLARARRRVTLSAAAERRRKERRRALEDARAAKDLAAGERTLYDALAERFGDQVRALSSDELAALLEDRLPEPGRRELLAWLEASQAARYAPRGAADKKGLFDDAERLLAALEELP